MEGMLEGEAEKKKGREGEGQGEMKGGLRERGDLADSLRGWSP